MRPSDTERDMMLERFVDRAVAQISVPPRNAPRPRRLMLLPMLGGVVAAIFVVASALGIGVALNEARNGVASQSSSPPGSGPRREPADLAVLPWESGVVDALGAADLSVQSIGASHEEGALGARLPARVFTVTTPPASGGFGRGADVIFMKDGGLGSPPAINVCGSPGTAPGRTRSVTYVDGLRVGSSDNSATVYHLFNANYYVQAYDAATRDALQRALGLAPAQCPERVTIGGHPYLLSAYLWRDFMPVAPPGGRPLAASLMIKSLDGSPIPANITADHMWVFNASQASGSPTRPALERQGVLVWDASSVEVRRPSATAPALEVVAVDGPKWDPGTYVSIVLRLQVAGTDYLLGLPDVEIKSTS